MIQNSHCSYIPQFILSDTGKVWQMCALEETTLHMIFYLLISPSFCFKSCVNLTLKVQRVYTTPF